MTLDEIFAANGTDDAICIVDSQLCEGPLTPHLRLGLDLANTSGDELVLVPELLCQRHWLRDRKSMVNWVY